MITETELSALSSSVAARLSEKRFAHTKGVEEEIVRMGAIYLPDRIPELRAAALLHDVAKELPLEEQIAICREEGDRELETATRSPAILHGHAAASCVRLCFEKMLSAAAQEYKGELIPRDAYVELFTRLEFTSQITFGCRADEFCAKYDNMMAELGLEYPKIKEEDVPLLASSVNPVRLKNSPYPFKKEDFVEMYSKFVEK